MTTIGRNAPCPCGSGKKYKLCHLKEEEGAPLSDAERALAFHERDSDLIRQILGFARQEFGERWLDDCLSVFGVDLEEFGQYAYQLVVPVSLFHLPVREQLPIVAFLQRRSSRLAKEEYDWLEAQHRAWLSVWEIRSVEQGVGLSIEDLLTGETRFVHERGGASTLVNRDAIGACRRLRGLSVVAGCHRVPAT
jgi:hypothetical protein